MYDLIINNGQVVDGTGAPSFIGDIAVKDGKIVEVGKAGFLRGARARRSLDAEGCLTTPGWVDVHTHFDGQATWDPLLAPASVQGTTTVVMGNCGVGFAPCRMEDHDQLISVMEDVEDIPGAALHEGIDWQWESYPQYLDVLDAVPHAIDVGSQVAHCAVRYFVMGERAADHSIAAKPEEIDQMAHIVREGVAAGALGFTTSRTEYHVTRNGETMPGTYAAEEELLGIGRVLGELGSGVYGLVSDFFDDWEKEMDWMKRLSIETGRPVNYVLFFRHQKDYERVRQQLEYTRRAASEGARLIPHVGARPVNIMMGFEATVHPFMFHQNYAPLAELSPAERLVKLRDPKVREAILSEPVTVPETPVKNGSEILRAILTGFDQHFVLGSPPNYEPSPEQSIAGIAARQGRPPREVAYDMMLQNDGKELLYYPNFGYDSGDLRYQMEMLKDPSTVISLSDGGAHCGVLCDATMPSFLLSYLVRDRDGERLGLEQAVRMHTRDTARCVGLEDRGTLQPGMKADVNIIDFDALQLEKPEIVYDLPAGGKRVYQKVRGYRATVVAGECICEDGEPTGAYPGRLIRGSQPAPNGA